MTAPRRHNTEQEHHKKAFEIYHAQGLSRSCQKVATQLGVSLAAVKSWARSFDWTGRIREKEADAARQVADRSLPSLNAENLRNLKIVRAALLRLAKGIAEGKVRMQMGDLDRLVKLEEHLTNSQTDPYAWIRIETSPALLRARIREIALECGAFPELETGMIEAAGSSQPPEGDGIPK